MPGEILIRQRGNTLDIGDVDSPGLAAGALEVLAGALQYTYKEMLYGPRAYVDDRGVRHNMRFERRNLFAMVDGRLRTGQGMLPAVTRLLKQRGYGVSYQAIVDPERMRRSQPDWTRLGQIAYRYRQDECLRAIADNRCGIIEAPPGFGKTEVIGMGTKLFAEAICHVVLKSVPLAREVRARLLSRAPRVGFVGDGSNDQQRVTVVTADSLHLIKTGADVLFVDEAHQLMTRTYWAKLAETYSDCRSYALTATLDFRMDGADAEMRYLFGDPVFRLKYAEAAQAGLVVPILVSWIPVRHDCDPGAGKTGVAADRWGIWRNDFRNQTIAQHVNMYGPDEQVLILVAKVEHAANIWKFLPHFQIASGDTEGHAAWPQALPPMNRSRRIALQQAFAAKEVKKVIATDVWATGVDFRELTVVYRVCGRSGKTLNMQAPGRVSRVSEGKSFGTLHDIVDLWSPTRLNASRTRRRDYRSFGWSEENWPPLT